ncbi:unnamed protein product [Rotaria sp. Silwood1]|nr:unnamed protein product [Rotaria sp. Silwood1]
MCSNCDSLEATLWCKKCETGYCSPCYKSLHSAPALKTHVSVPIDQKPDARINQQGAKIDEQDVKINEQAGKINEKDAKISQQQDHINKLDLENQVMNKNYVDCKTVIQNLELNNRRLEQEGQQSANVANNLNDEVKLLKREIEERKRSSAASSEGPKTSLAPSGNTTGEWKAELENVLKIAVINWSLFSFEK